MQGRRRRPWVVKKTINGHQKAIGYFETHDAALTFLLKYNHEPTGLTATFADIYKQWRPTKWPTLSRSSQSAYEISFRHLARLHDKTMSQLKYLDLQAAMDDVRKVAGYSTQKKCRVLMSQLYQFAIKREMATTDYSRYVEIDRHRWDRTMKQMSMHHTPHECRHTLASLLDSAGVNDTVIKMILGHARRGVTKAVYTHKTLRELRKAVDIL